jgi:hypothetical protein
MEINRVAEEPFVYPAGALQCSTGDADLPDFAEFLGSMRSTAQAPRCA